MALDEDLAAAVAGREHWHTAGAAAIYTLPGVTATVRVQRVAQPAARERYRAVIILNGIAQHSVPASTAEEAVRWAERVPLP